MSEPKVTFVFLKKNFLVVALDEDLNGDVNKNTENGGTKSVIDQNGSNGSDPKSFYFI